MSTEENKTVVRRLIEEFWNQGQLSVADELYSTDAVHRDPVTPDLGSGPESIKQLRTLYGTSFPDQQFTVDDLVAEGDKVVLRWTVRGTHQGELMGIAPTGQQVTVTGITIYRLANGKIAEEVTSWDAFGLMQQLGAIPLTMKAGSGSQP
ncbi:MAG: ester cyclase [Acidobacteria bacterium]|nr:ester cyclase [Acidobacteriota bacterium]